MRKFRLHRWFTKKTLQKKNYNTNTSTPVIGEDTLFIKPHHIEFHKVIKVETNNNDKQNSSSNTNTNNNNLIQSPSTESESSYSTQLSTPTEASKISNNKHDRMSNRNNQNHHHQQHQQYHQKDDVALADKEMEERANRAKELLSMRHKGMRHEQVSLHYLHTCVFHKHG